ncbi:MAG: cytochrome c3 family protein [Desulfovibrionaceae bacterium]
MRAILFVFAALLCLVLAGWGFSGIEAAAPPTTDMLIALPAHGAGAVLTQPRVAFPHARHKRIDGSFFECAYCHHKWNQAGDPGKCAAPGCHDRLPQDAVAGEPAYRVFRNAYHGEADFSCNGCHRARAQAGKPHGPLACGACHNQAS